MALFAMNSPMPGREPFLRSKRSRLSSQGAVCNAVPGSYKIVGNKDDAEPICESMTCWEARRVDDEFV